MVFCGGEGSLLLMQPDSMDAATSKLASTFIIASWNRSTNRLTRHLDCHSRCRGLAAAAADPACGCPRTSYGCRDASYRRRAEPARSAHTVLGARRYWIYDGPADA